MSEKRKQKTVTFSGELGEELEQIRAYCADNQLSLPGTLVKLGLKFIEGRGGIFDETSNKKDSGKDT